MTQLWNEKTRKWSLNKSEKQCRQALESEGWKVLHRGWPDFFCWRDMNGTREYRLIEVKRTPHDKPTGHQRTLLAELSALHLPIFLWNPKQGFSQCGAVPRSVRSISTSKRKRIVEILADIRRGADESTVLYVLELLELVAAIAPEELDEVRFK